MAKYNEILAGRFNRALQKILSMKGEAPSPQLSSEIVAAINLLVGTDTYILQGWNLFGVGQSQPAVAAQNSSCQLRNPTGSGVIAVITKISVFATVADQGASLTNDYQVDLATVQSSVGLDQRTWPNPTTPNKGTIIPSRGNNVGTSGFILQTFATQTTAILDLLIPDEQQLPLLPGDAIRLITGAVNTALSVNWMWRERPLEDSEFQRGQ